MFLALLSCDPASARARTYFPAARRHRPDLVEIDPSDNPEKATGSAAEVERYLRVFGNAGRVRSAVHV